MISTFAKISSEQLCKILNISDLRALQTTTDFPKPLFNEGDLLFDKKEVAKYFNLDNIDEPFITLKEAAEYIGLPDSRILSLTKNDEIPSYRLKSTKGSGYLFRKSELEFLKEIQIEGNINFVNYFSGTEVLRNLFKAYIEGNFKNHCTIREYDVFMMHFFGRWSLEKIGEEFDLTRNRVNQIYQRTIRRIYNRVNIESKSNLLELERKIIHKDIEIKFLKGLLEKNNPEQYQTLNYDSMEIKSLEEIYLSFFKKDIYNEDLSVRALNSLKHINIITIYNLITLFGSHSNDQKNLHNQRNVGKKTADEVIEYIKIKELEIQKLTGISCEDFMNKKSDNEKYIFLFNQIHEKIKSNKFHII